jgi:UDP-glucose:(heptosyl)LPS alpha-1,3-glucosyltransferase
MWTMLTFAAVAKRRLRQIVPDVAIGLGRVPGLEIYRAGGGCHDAYLDTVPRWWLSIRQHVERWIDRASVLSAKRVITNAPRPRLELVERYGADPERVVVIPNGVDAHRFQPDAAVRAEVREALGVQSGRRLVVFLGSGFVRKGLDRALETVAQLEDVELAVIGADGRQSRFEMQAAHLGVTAHFVGAHSRPERFLAAADLMLLPTRYDAAANAVLEAMACGVPVITTATNGAHAFLPEHWMTVSSAEDVPGLVAASGRALDTEGLGARCRQVALEMTPEKNRDAVLAVVEALRGTG